MSLDPETRASDVAVSQAPEPGSASLRAVRLSKWYGKVTALQDVSLHLDPGIWGLLGPNGSGKTTLLRCAAGQLIPSVGEIRVCGEAPFARPEVLRHIGLCPEADAMYDELTAHEFVLSMAELSGFSKKEAASRAEEALHAFGLKDAMHRRVGGYSRGMRQRTKLAQAVVHDPKVLLLDEPLTGTDPASRHMILEAIRKRAQQGALVLFSSHVLPEVEALTQQVLLIARGQVVAQGEMADIRTLLDEHPHHVEVRCSKARDLAAAVLKDDGIVGIRFSGDDAVQFATQNPDETYQAVMRAAIAGGHDIQSITSPDATLEALFHYLVERGSRGAGTGADAAVGTMSLTHLADRGTGTPYTSQLQPGDKS